VSAAESWENICCRCGSEIKETEHPGKRACHVTCGPCLYPDNPKCASCEIVGYCRLALDYFKSLKPSVVKKRVYFKEQLTGEETLYHTLSFVNAHQNLVKSLGEKKYLRSLVEANSRRASLPIKMKELPRKSKAFQEKARDIEAREKERRLVLTEIENRGPSTISELAEFTRMEKSRLLRHLTAMRQFGKVSIVGERDRQPVYDLLE